MHALCLMLASLLGSDSTIDDFRYGDTAAARAVWTAGDDSPAVEVVSEERPIMRLSIRLPLSQN